MKLTEDQVKRLYNEFDFDENEEIIFADYYGNGKFDICLYDNLDKVSWDYIPNEIEEERTKYILEGVR